MPVASVTTRISCSSDSAASSSPKNERTLLQMVRTNGSEVSAPASRASLTCRVDSSAQASSSQRFKAIQLQNHSQRTSCGARTVSPRKALSASLRIGVPAAYPWVNRIANPWRRRSGGRGGCGGGGGGERGGGDRPP